MTNTESDPKPFSISGTLRVAGGTVLFGSGLSLESSPSTTSAVVGGLLMGAGLILNGSVAYDHDFGAGSTGKLLQKIRPRTIFRRRGQL